MNTDAMTSTPRAALVLALAVCACAKDEPPPPAPPLTTSERVARDPNAHLRAAQRCTLRDVSAYGRAYVQWRDNHPEATTCPTVVQLDQQLASPHNLRDPWGSEYLVTCAPGGMGVRVTSAGPDKTHGTPDDIGPDWKDPDRQPMP